MKERFSLLVIGGGPAGLSAARSYRQAGGQGPVAIVGDEHRMPYRRPPLTKELLRGDSTEEDLPIERESWLSEHEVSLVSGRAVALDADAHTVLLSGGRELKYRQCLLATGAEPTRLPVQGADDPAVRVLRTLDHLRELQRRLGRGESAVVIGSGFIGCEIAASLRMRGHRVALVSDETAPNVARLGDEAAAVLAGWLREQGVSLHLGTAVERIQRAGHEFEVIADGGSVRGDVLIMATGVAPRGELAAAAAGIELADGAIPVSADMRSARADVLAAGDVCRAQNLAAGRPLRVEHWGDALTQGEIAGATAAGKQAAWDEVPGFWSTIGSRTLKYAAWGDGYDQIRFESHPDGGFTVWYGREGQIVGVLTHETDEDYEQGAELIKRGAPWS
ncbi:MAG TPA: FAD-dependent oxidoreductase [Solirubrobacteraceae bacterium]|nr:FAD-dependent oxidoreductase [Solirubrobacteraceae bacterium]